MAGAVREMTAVRRAVLVLVLGAGVAGVGLAVAHPQVFASSTAEAGMPGFVWEPEEDPAVSPGEEDPTVFPGEEGSTVSPKGEGTVVFPAEDETVVLPDEDDAVVLPGADEAVVSPGEEEAVVDGTVTEEGTAGAGTPPAPERPWTLVGPRD